MPSVLFIVFDVSENKKINTLTTVNIAISYTDARLTITEWMTADRPKINIRLKIFDPITFPSCP